MDKVVNSRSDCKARVKESPDNFGLPGLIIIGLLPLVFVPTPFVGADLSIQITNTVDHFSWNAVMALAVVPVVYSGCGPNLGLPPGIIPGLLGATMSIQFGLNGPMSFMMAILISTPFAVIFGGDYDWLLNKIKDGEMMIAAYVGLFSVPFMCMIWLLLPYSGLTMVWGLVGKKPCTAIPLEEFYGKVLASFLQTNINHLSIPVDSLLLFVLLVFLMWAFLHTKTGTVMTTVGFNPVFARASGVNIDKTGMLSVIMPTWPVAVDTPMHE